MSKEFYARVCFLALVLGVFVEMVGYVYITHNALVYKTGIDITIACLALVQAFVLSKKYRYPTPETISRTQELASLLQGLTVFGLAFYGAWAIGGVWRSGLLAALLVGLVLRLIVKTCMQRYSQLHNSVEC